MALYKALNLEYTEGELICFIGGGGKTSSMFHLAKEVKNQGKKVLITTTTAIYNPTPDHYDELIILKGEDRFEEFILNFTPNVGITVMGGGISSDGKLLSVEEDLLKALQKGKYFDVIIVEADGAKKLPLKAPADHEPVIPKGATKVVAVIGMDVFGGKTIERIVHRWEQFCKITKSDPKEQVSEGRVVKLVVHPEGSFKGTPEGCLKYLLLNKVDLDKRRVAAIKIVDLLKKEDFQLEGVVISSMMRQEFQLIKWRKNDD